MEDLKIEVLTEVGSTASVGSKEIDFKIIDSSGAVYEGILTIVFYDREDYTPPSPPVPITAINFSQTSLLLSTETHTLAPPTLTTVTLRTQF